MHKSASPTITVPEWDWHYRVGFDAELARRIACAADRIERSEEVEILKGTLNWGCGFISIDRLIEALETSEVSPDILPKLERDKLLHLPAMLADKVGARIARLVGSRGSATGRGLDHILTAALAAPYRPLARDLFELVFGAKLQSLLQEAALVAPVPHPGFEPISPSQARELVETFVREASGHPFLRGLLDVHAIEVHYTEESSGFAEYWPHELIPGRTNDLLIIHLNGQSLDRLTLQSTLCHEIYGHASFYSLFRISQPPLVDHGAILLVEGWATGCEWRFSNPRYAAWSRSRRLIALSRLDATAEELTKKIDVMIWEDRYPLNRDDRLTQAFQYPALAESYALGGLWFESETHTGKILDLARFLKKRAWGDFMATWYL